jgi:hypothetical protein
MPLWCCIHTPKCALHQPRAARTQRVHRKLMAQKEQRAASRPSLSLSSITLRPGVEKEPLALMAVNFKASSRNLRSVLIFSKAPKDWLWEIFYIEWLSFLWTLCLGKLCECYLHTDTWVILCHYMCRTAPNLTFYASDEPWELKQSEPRYVLAQP